MGYNTIEPLPNVDNLGLEDRGLLQKDSGTSNIIVSDHNIRARTDTLKGDFISLGSRWSGSIHLTWAAGGLHHVIVDGAQGTTANYTSSKEHAGRYIDKSCGAVAFNGNTIRGGALNHRTVHYLSPNSQPSGLHMNRV